MKLHSMLEKHKGVQLTSLDQPQKSYRSQDASKTRQQQNITDSRLRNISAPLKQHYFKQLESKQTTPKHAFLLQPKIPGAKQNIQDQLSS